MADMTLKALLFGEDKSMSKSFKGAGKAAEETEKKVGGASKGIKGHVKGLSNALHGDFTGLTSSIAGGVSMLGPVGIAAGAAIAGVGVGLGVLAKGAGDAIDTFKNVAGETLKLQRIVGGTAEDASRLRFEFQQTGVDGEASAKAMGIFSKNLVAMAPHMKKVTLHVAEATGEWRKQTTIVRDAAGHFHKLEQMVPVMKMKTITETVKVANPVLAKLGIVARDAAGHIRPMADLLPELADKFSKMPNGAEKSALALKLFGKGGLALLPFLNRGAAGLAELKKKSDEFGLTLSGKDLAALKASRLAHKDWDAAMEGAKVRIGAQLLPMLTKLVVYFETKMIPIIVKAGQWVQKHGDQIQRTAAAIGHAIVVMVQVWLTWEKVVFTVVTAVAKIFMWLWGALKTVIYLILQGVALIEIGFGKMIGALSHVPGFKWARGLADSMYAAAKQARGMADALVAVRNAARAPIVVNTYFQTHGSPPAASGKGGNVRASGGPVRAGVPYLVGEREPELFVPNQSGMIYNGRQMAAMAGHGSAASGGSDGVARLEVVVKTDTGQVIERKLVDLRRRRGSKLAFV